MSRIGACFDDLRQAHRQALIVFITAGDPEPRVTVPLMHALVAAGADIVELGVPFSDPMADGPVIQRASERALSHRVSLQDVLGMVSAFREHDVRTPLVLMGYLNPIEAMGWDAFAMAGAQAGIDGVLTVDMPPEEADELVSSLAARDIDPIFLLAPTTTESRIAKICARGRGFLYYVSLKGVTGARNLDVSAVSNKVSHIRQVTDLPVAVGFGVRDAASAARLAPICDGVVVGSALVERMEALIDAPETILSKVTPLIGEMRQAMDSVREQQVG